MKRRRGRPSNTQRELEWIAAEARGDRPVPEDDGRRPRIDGHVSWIQYGQMQRKVIDAAERGEPLSAPAGVWVEWAQMYARHALETARHQAVDSRALEREQAEDACEKHRHRVDDLLRRAGLTKKRWAEVAGVPRSSVFDYRRGRSHPQLGTERHLLEALKRFGVTLDRLPRK